MNQMVRFWVVLIIVITAFAVCLAGDSLPVPVRVDGVMREKQNSFAIVNGQVCKVGDKIHGAEIIEITDNAVKFNYKGTVYTLPVGIGTNPARAKPVAKKDTSVSAITKKITGLFKSRTKKSGQGSLLNADHRDDQAIIDKIFNTKVEPNPSYFEEYYSKALHYYNQAESQASVNKEGAFALYGEAAQASAWAIQYGLRACAQKHDERAKMFEILNMSLSKRTEMKQ